MSCIIALVTEDGGVVMGGDSAASDEDRIEVRRDPKVAIRGKVLIGSTNSFRVAQLLQHSLVIPSRPPSVRLSRYMATSFVNAISKCLKRGRATDDDTKDTLILVATEGHIFRIDGDHSVAEVSTTWEAIGCGAEAARGALLTQDIMLTQARRNKRPFAYPAQQRVTDALGVAERLTAYVRKPFTIVQLPGNGG